MYILFAAFFFQYIFVSFYSLYDNRTITIFTVILLFKNYKNQFFISISLYIVLSSHYLKCNHPETKTLFLQIPKSACYGLNYITDTNVCIGSDLDIVLYQIHFTYSL